MQFEIPVILGSVRRGRNTPRLARFLDRKLTESGRVSSSIVDLAELDLPIMEERLRFLEDPPAALVEFGRRIDAAHAIVIATPEYNKGYPGVLKNAIDYLGPEYRRKPVGIATHSVGSFGGIVALQQLRLVILNLGAVPIPSAVTVPNIEAALGADGASIDEAFERRGDRFVEELLWYAEALLRQRQASA